MLKRPRTPTNNPSMDYHTADSKLLMKRTRPLGISDDASNLPVAYDIHWPKHAQSLFSSDELPKNVVTSLNQGSVVRSMDFHPVQ
ncbi:hypothetical protein IFM89_036157 [Coptis chinensis]|uniref:Uncharacterized protein n=1 Tax=Coptis chinensis TaxID=261450 RepID=A0A835H310_9MAGN|nr:hypothetical protein IFM89_036150 [Coptis chinensis]KAF9590665.1 hypothetical protein IFM89_036157 [Coptis chinensis]